MKNDQLKTLQDIAKLQECMLNEYCEIIANGKLKPEDVEMGKVLINAMDKIQILFEVQGLLHEASEYMENANKERNH